MLKDVKNKKIVLDTNFLLIPAQFRVDIFAELERICDFNYEVCVLEETVKELEGLASDKSCRLKDRNAAKLGIQLIKAMDVSVVRQQRKVFKSADKAILDFATAMSKAGDKPVILATQDRELRDKLAAKGVAVIVLRQKQYLMFYS